MKIDEEKVRAWFDNFAISCRICGGSQWNLIEEYLEMPVYRDDTKSRPAVCLMCKNCGEMRFFDAKNIGLIEQEGEGAE